MFEWLEVFHKGTEKPENYAEKTLAAYALGIKAGGSLRGVRVEVDASSCAPARSLAPDAVYPPDQAPRLPLSGCPKGTACTCVYRPVMLYEEPSR